MADKLQFSLVSPERELFSGAVDQVDIPGTEGDFGVLPDHAPLMAAIRTGAITVYEGGTQTQFFVRGGFADVTPEGLTVLAERATPMNELDRAELETRIQTAEAALADLSGEALLVAQDDLEGMRSVLV